MRLEDFDYHLPEELIARFPAEKRDGSRLMLLDPKTDSIGETTFSGLLDHLHPGDLLVMNDTRVIPARILGRKASGGKAEVFLVRRLQQPGEVWQCLLKSSKPSKPGTEILLPEGLTAVVLEQDQEGQYLVAFSPADDFQERLERAGNMPLPPYLGRSAEISDQERYQTVFAREKGAVAAPTAGLHMTGELLEQLGSKGVELLSLTLHVGLGTFLPVRVSDISSHRMHRERYHIPEATAAAIAAAKREGRRVVALGTTSARALEHSAAVTGNPLHGHGEADIFIYPGYRFRVISGLVTNFHLPKSTLLMMVAALAGKDFLFRAYAEAISRRFRFYSYGDAMFIQ